MAQPFLNHLGNLYDSFCAEEFHDNFLQDAAASLSLLFLDDGDPSNPNPGPRYTMPPFSSIEEMRTYSKFLRWKRKIDYGGMVRLALAAGWVPSPEEYLRKLGYTQFDKETGFPTHGGDDGAELTAAEMLNGKREFLRQKKLHDAVRVFKPKSWDDTQPSALLFAQRKKVLKLKEKVREWDKQRREEEKSAPPAPPPASPPHQLHSFRKARKYDKDRRNKRASKATMLAMLAAENQLDALLEKMEGKASGDAKSSHSEAKEESRPPLHEPTPPSPPTQPSSKKQSYGAVSAAVPLSPFLPNAPAWVPPLRSCQYQAIRERRAKAAGVADRVREGIPPGADVARSKRAKARAKVVTRWGPYRRAAPKE